MSFSFKTDIGKYRKKNEDSTIIVENDSHDIFMMAMDGMGGHNLGDLASSLAEDYLIKAFNKKKKFLCKLDMKWWLRRTIKKTNDYLFKYTNNVPSSKGMGTTFTCYLIHKNTVLMCYIGDTRAYIIKDKKMIQQSIDETYVEYLYRLGRLKREDMKNHPSKHVITNALGCYEQISINLKFIKDEYDYLLLCSDGLYNMVNEDKIAEIIYDNNLDEAVDILIKEANEAGGLDNIAIALYKKGGE